MGVHIYNKHFKKRARAYRVLGRFYGIGQTRIDFLLALIGVTRRAKVQDLGWYKVELLGFYLRVLFVIDLRLRKYTNFYLYRIGASGNYTASRFEHGLPSRGQRTHTNAKTTRLHRGRHSVDGLSI